MVALRPRGEGDRDGDFPDPAAFQRAFGDEAEGEPVDVGFEIELVNLFASAYGWDERGVLYAGPDYADLVDLAQLIGRDRERDMMNQAQLSGHPLAEEGFVSGQEPAGETVKMKLSLYGQEGRN